MLILFLLLLLSLTSYFDGSKPRSVQILVYNSSIGLLGFSLCKQRTSLGKFIVIRLVGYNIIIPIFAWWNKSYQEDEQPLLS